MNRKSIGWRIRGLIMARAYHAHDDCFVCSLCSCRMYEDDVVIDHIVPVARGGTNDPANLQVSCVTCNQVKRDRDPDDDFEHLIWAAKGDPEYTDKPALRLVKS